MNTILLILLGLTALAIPAMRGWAVKNGAPLWEDTQKCNAYNLGWVVGLWAVYLTVWIVVDLPMWFGFIMAIPLLPIIAYSLIAAGDWNTARRFQAWMDKIAYGGGSWAAAKFRMKIRRYAALGVFCLLLFGLVAFAIVGPDNGNDDSQNQAKDRGTVTAPASPAAPTTTSAAPSTAAPSSATPSADKTSSDPCVNTDVTLAKANRPSKLSNDIDVCVDGKWVSKTYPANTKVTIVGWARDGQGGEYDEIMLADGTRLLTHSFKV